MPIPTKFHKITTLMQSATFDSRTATISPDVKLTADELLEMMPQISTMLAIKPNHEMIVTSIQTVFETLGKQPPTRLALQTFATILKDIPAIFMEDITLSICAEIPNSRPIPKDWADRSASKVAEMQLLRHAIRKELKRRGVLTQNDKIYGDILTNSTKQ